MTKEFMFKKHNRERRSSNPIILLFRMIISLVMFAVLLAGTYSAYKHFSGMDPLKIDPQAVVRELLQSKTPQQFLSVLASIKITQGLSEQINNKVLGEAASSGIDNPQGISSIVLPGLPGSSQPASGNVVFKFLIVADTHNDNSNLQKTIFQAKSANPDIPFIVGLGDYTDVGTIAELKSAKVKFDESGLRYFLVAGDHDLWDARNRNLSAYSNFKQVFGPLYQAFTYKNFKFLLLDNSDNYIGIDETQKIWISNELEKAKNEGVSGIFVFIHSPLYHPSSDHYMGKVDKALKSQAESLIYQLKEAGVKKVFSGDIHYFSEFEEPVTKMPMNTIGAVTIERNPQAPRYGVVSIFDDGTSRVEDIQIQ